MNTSIAVSRRGKTRESLDGVKWAPEDTGDHAAMGDAACLNAQKVAPLGAGDGARPEGRRFRAYGSAGGGRLAT